MEHFDASSFVRSFNCAFVDSLLHQRNQLRLVSIKFLFLFGVGLRIQFLPRNLKNVKVLPPVIARNWFVES